MRSFFSVRILWLSLVFSVMCCSSVSVLAEQELTRADKLKAAYLFNFTKYLQWPDNNFPSKDDGIKLCVQASTSFFQFLVALTNNRTVGREARTIEIIKPDRDSICHLSYVPEREAKVLFSSGVLVTDDSSNSQSSAIVFFMQGDKVRFDINRDQLADLQVKASSELLKLSRTR